MIFERKMTHKMKSKALNEALNLKYCIFWKSYF